MIHRELHVFSDASELGYGTTIYVKSINEQEEIRCSLVFSKGRVTHLKEITVPRLELTAASLALRIAKMVRRKLDFEVNNTKFIANDRIRYHAFVENCVYVIWKVSVPGKGLYVNTKESPAELASRGVHKMQIMLLAYGFMGQAFYGHHSLTGQAVVMISRLIWLIQKLKVALQFWGQKSKQWLKFLQQEYRIG